MADYKCPACGKDFASQEEMAKHGQESHMGNQNQNAEHTHEDHSHEEQKHE